MSVLGGEPAPEVAYSTRAAERLRWRSDDGDARICKRHDAP